jgi:cell division protein FtsB
MFIQYIFQGSRSLHSSSSQRRTTQSVSTKLEELKTYREILVTQIDSLQSYFDAMQTSETQASDVVNPIDFKGKYKTLK